MKTDNRDLDYRVSFSTIKQYNGELFYDTRAEAEEMILTMVDESIIECSMHFMPERKGLSRFVNQHAGAPITKDSPVEKGHIGTLDGLSAQGEVDYSNFQG